MKPRKPSTLPLEKRLAVPIGEAADAFTCSKFTIYAMGKKGQLDLVKVSGQYRVTTASIKRVLAGQAA